jgi:hypothetical protein
MLLSRYQDAVEVFKAAVEVLRLLLTYKENTYKREIFIFGTEQHAFAHLG